MAWYILEIPPADEWDGFTDYLPIQTELSGEELVERLVGALQNQLDKYNAWCKDCDKWREKLNTKNPLPYPPSVDNYITVGKRALGFYHFTIEGQLQVPRIWTLEEWAKIRGEQY